MKVVEHQVTFEFPIFSYLIPVALLLLLAISLLAKRSSRKRVAAFGRREVLERFSRLRGRKLRHTIYIAIVVVSFLITLAELTIPKGTGRSERVLDYVAVVDISRSADAEDSEGISRAGMARSALYSLLSTFPKGRVGLVLFTNVVTSYEPSTDHSGMRFVLQYAAVPHYARGAGSDIAAGLEEAQLLVEEFAPDIKTIVLLTDGGDAVPSALHGVTARLVGEQIRVITVGLGGDEPVPIPNRDPKTGEIVSYHQLSGQKALTQLNELPLLAIARATGGDYVRLEEVGDLAETIVHNSSKYTTTRSRETEGVSLARWCLIPVLLVVALWCIDKRFFRG